ncbi:MAG: hypothetical protein ACJ746_22935 [Bryobacteraceae bacterium]
MRERAGLAGPIVTSKHSQHLPFYRVEDLFASMCLETSRSIQSAPACRDTIFAAAAGVAGKRP